MQEGASVVDTHVNLLRVSASWHPVQSLDTLTTSVLPSPGDTVSLASSPGREGKTTSANISNTNKTDWKIHRLDGVLELSTAADGGQEHTQKV